MRAKEFLLEFAVPDDDLKWLADHSTSRLKTAIIKAFKAQHKSEQAHKASQAHKIDIERHEKPPEQRKKKDPRLAKPIDEDYDYDDAKFFWWEKTNPRPRITRIEDKFTPVAQTWLRVCLV